MMAEIKKILDPQIKLTATCVRVPVFAGHALAVNVTFEKDPDAEEAREILRESPGLIVMDKHEDGGYATPLDSVGEFAVYVSRIAMIPQRTRLLISGWWPTIFVKVQLSILSRLLNP